MTSPNITIRILDPVNYKKYDSGILDTEPLGGTEATVVRVASLLASKEKNVTVYQKHRDDISCDITGVNYKPLLEYNKDIKTADAITIVLRDIGVACGIKNDNPNEKIFLWLHDLQQASADSVRYYELAASLGIEFICVSEYHKNQVNHIKHLGNITNLPTHCVPNLVTVRKSGDVPSPGSDDLLFFSSPHKGLRETVNTFSRFKDFPELAHFKLVVSNPGYYEIPDDLKNKPGVIILDPMSHASMMKRLESSFCVLHLNSVFPETFGLVHAEAMALGVPVITSRLGANPEILTHPHFMCDVTDTRAIILKLIDWVKYGAPKPRLDNKYSPDNVYKKWEGLLRK
jgi:glycosyltransferase involved in cell wall biosynthesis